MNASPDNLTGSSSDKAMAEALMSIRGLSSESLERIVDTMRSERVSFGEAALQLGLATPKDLEDASLWLGRQDGSPSLIETAIRRAQGNTSLALRSGEMVQPGHQLTLLHSPDSPHSERIRALRTELMLLLEDVRRGNICALLSPGPAEGRSQLCAELAIAFAQLGRRTLLVDADLRHPRQHVFFGADNQWGLAQALALGETPYLYTVQGVPELSLMTAGVIPPNPLELVSNRRFDRMVSDWRRTYDFVLIDTPPVSLYADALAIATAARRVLVVSRTETTSFTSMKELLRRLAPTQARILGAVLNKF
jgi:receptor protein-tyrosine kinase